MKTTDQDRDTNSTTHSDHLEKTSSQHKKHPFLTGFTILSLLIAIYFVSRILGDYQMTLGSPASAESIDTPEPVPQVLPTPNENKDNLELGLREIQRTPAPSKEPLIQPNNRLFSRRFEECTQLTLSKEASTPEDLIKSLSHEYGVEDDRIEIENYHLILPNKEQRRIHIRQKDSENGRAKEVLLFGVDKEDLPIPIPLPEKTAVNPTREFIQFLLKQGAVQSRQRKQVLTFKNGLHAQVDWLNNSVRDLEIYTPYRSFFCRYLECKCL